VNKKNSVVRFEQFEEQASFHLPGATGATGQSIIWRFDPLTRRVSLYSEDLVRKAWMLFGKTDREMMERLAGESRSNCFFCPEKVETTTPRYPDDLIPGGRLYGSSTILFPNLFPVMQIHAVITIPSRHFMHPGDFSSEVLSEIFMISHDFIRAIDRRYPEIRFISINSNHMPPAGASLLHPHFQIAGSRFTPEIVSNLLGAVSAFFREHAVCYWDSLTEAEAAAGERFIGATGSWSWIAAFAPSGPNEIYAVHRNKKTVFELNSGDYSALAEGLSRVLAHFHQLDYSSFNFSLTGGDKAPHEADRCLARIITRQNFRANYRADDYFLQKLLGAELIVTAPEHLASQLRKRF
jgi:UDPglucose--hexose-1-phosphate uridylyltransferase